MEPGQILQHTDHGRIIMSENIQFQEVVVNLVIIKVRRDRVFILGRVLNRCKCVNLLSVGQNDDTARMLPGRFPDADTAIRQALDLRRPFFLPMILKVPEHITVRILVRHTRHRSGSKRLPCAEDYLRIMVRFRLILSGEVQVNIRLLVSFEAKEGLKRDVKAKLLKLCPALRTVFIRHIAAGHTVVLPDFRRIKVHIVAFRTEVMRMQGVDLRDAGHVGDKGRPDRSARPDQIPVRHRLPYQLLGNDVHDGKSIGDDGVQLLLQAVLHHLRKVVAVDLMCPVVADLRQHFIRVRDDGRTLVRPDRRELLHHVRNPVGVCDDDLVRLLLPQILELLQHLLRRAQIQRRLVVRLRILKIHILKNPPVDLILRVQEMDVAGRTHGLAVLLSERDNPTVVVFQILDGLRLISEVSILVIFRNGQKHVVADRLDFQIVIEIHNPLQFLL